MALGICLGTLAYSVYLIAILFVYRYDQKVFADVLDVDGTVLVEGALIYVATSDISRNKNWGGPVKLPEIAKQISLAHGPSGPNYEYLFGMAEGLRNIGPHAQDDHVFELEALVRQLMDTKEKMIDVELQ